MNIKDMNDNQPEFLTFENPVSVSVSSQLQPGDVIAKMEVTNAETYNVQIKILNTRYQIQIQKQMLELCLPLKYLLHYFSQ